MTEVVGVVAAAAAVDDGGLTWHRTVPVDDVVETNSDYSSDVAPDQIRRTDVGIDAAVYSAAGGWFDVRRYLLAEGKWADRLDCYAPAIVNGARDCGFVNEAAVVHLVVALAEVADLRVGDRFGLSVVIVVAVARKLPVGVGVTYDVGPPTLAHLRPSPLLSA